MIKTKLLLFFISTAFISIKVSGQVDGVIRTTDGYKIMNKSVFISQCKKLYAASGDNSLITQTCECQASFLNDRFSVRQLGFYQERYGEKALSVLMEQDVDLQKKMRECGSGIEHLLLVSLPASRKNLVSKCVENIKRNSVKPVNDTLAAKFCNCAAEVMQKRKITIERIEELSDPSSFLYNEIAYQCGSPFLKSTDFALQWKATDSVDINGEVRLDSVQIVSVMGMHKIKITIGGIARVWLIDSGASDLLISEEYAKELKEKGAISELNYIGEGLYSLADNSIITCRRYKINGLKIGRFVLNNVTLATSKSAKEFLLGKSVLNKFSQWSLDNKADLLILRK